jgi:hypothetical protein
MKEKGKSFVNEHDVLHEVKQELTDYEEDLGRHYRHHPVFSSVADPDPGWVKKSKSGTGMNIPDHISKSLEAMFCVKIFKLFDADPDLGIFLTLDHGWKKFGSGIWEKHSGSATMVFSLVLLN